MKTETPTFTVEEAAKVLGTTVEVVTTECAKLGMTPLRYVRYCEYADYCMTAETRTEGPTTI